MSQVLSEQDVRDAGGIVHRDGNVFFTNIDKLNAAILAKLADRLKDSEDADSMMMAMKAVIDKDDARWRFLHTTSKDTEGFEWCVLRVKWENGRISEAWHTNQDLKDLDAAIDAQKCKPCN